MKEKLLLKTANHERIIAALAIDQRPILEKMLRDSGLLSVKKEDIETFKKIVVEELSPFSSSVLLDPIYGFPAIDFLKKTDCGLLIAHEETGYGQNDINRMPTPSEEWSVENIKKCGADAVKFLIYYDIDGNKETNQSKQDIIENIGKECKKHQIPFFLEPLAYDSINNLDTNGIEFSKTRPRKINSMIKLFSEKKFGVDILKVETPVNMNYVEGFSEKAFLHSKLEAANLFKQQSDWCKIPFIFLSAGVSAELFIETLKFAEESGSEFSGVLCGRATWADAVPHFVQGGEKSLRKWLKTTGKKNILRLNEVLSKSAYPLP